MAAVMASKRLVKELIDFARDSPTWCTVELEDESSMLKWNATINGPVDTPYAGGVFKLSFVFARDYPFRPPKVTFATKIYHPNINKDGLISLDILRETWAPARTVFSVLSDVRELLQNPNAEDPLVPEIARVYETDPALYHSTAREWTRIYALVDESHISSFQVDDKE